VLRRPSELAAVIGNLKSWYGTCPVTRLDVQVTASKRSEDIFRIAGYAGVAPDFVQMRAWGGYDLVRSMPEVLRLGDT
jgi:hypothetical protein